MTDDWFSESHEIFSSLKSKRREWFFRRIDTEKEDEEENKYYNGQISTTVENIMFWLLLLHTSQYS